MTFQLVKNDQLNCELQYITVNNEPWFRGKTVATILGYTDTKQAIRKNIDNDDKQKLGEFEGGVSQTPLTNNQKNTVMINESGLYCLILASKLPTAKKFKRWVTKEVLPTIRKKGTYSVVEDSEDEECVATEMSDTITRLEGAIANLAGVKACTWQKEVFVKMIEDSYLDNRDLSATQKIIDKLEYDNKRIDALPFKHTTKLRMKKELFAKYRDHDVLDWIQMS